ncbi:hypothetical protein H5T87_06425 [bacterium]|nr:hypothetical protein [bacterium]
MKHFFTPKISVGFFLLTLSIVQCQPERVAIFSHPLFPRFGATSNFHPKSLALYLLRFGIPTDLLDANQLADPQQFNASKYAILIHPYGNTFPLEAVDNIRNFHSQGGSIIGVSVPFCHPCIAKGAKDWQFFLGEGDSAERYPQPHTGKFSLLVRKNSKVWTIIKSAYLNRDADSYTLSAWVKVLNGEIGKDREGDRLFLRFWDENGNFLGQDGPVLPQKQEEWIFICQDVKLPKNARKIDVILALNRSVGELLIDDISLKRRGKSEELLPNGGFEFMDAPWIDLGHSDEWFSHNGIGMGSFYTPQNISSDYFYISNGEGKLTYMKQQDPLGLEIIDWGRYENSYTQMLAPGSLPSEDEVIPVIGYYENGKLYPAIAVIKHNCHQFKGAIDIWLGQVFQFHSEGQGLIDLRQVYLHSVLYILSEKGIISQKKKLKIVNLAKGEYRKNFRPKLRGKLLSFPSVFPHSPPPARKLIVCDVRNLADDEKLMIVSLQGIINRRNPSIYLIFNPVDERWLWWLKERGDIEGIERLDNPFALLGRYRKNLKGMIITDPAIPASIDAGTMLAGIEDGIIVSPRLVPRLSLPILHDLRGRWKSNAEVYRWAFKNLWDKLNHQFIFSLPHNWSVMRDYAIAFRAFSFWITGEVDGQAPAADPLEEQLVIEDVLSAIPPNTGVLGIPYAGPGIGIQEVGGVALWSKYGKFLAWSHIPNLTIHSGTKRPNFSQKSIPPPNLGSKIYLTLLISDGDAPVNWYDFFLRRYWDDPEKGRFPLTWTVGPTVYDLIPDIMDYYYSHATEKDYFVCAFGAGYAFMDLYGEMFENREEIWERFLQLTREYMEKMGLDSLWTHHEGERFFKIYSKKLNLKCILADYGRALRVDSYEKSSMLLPSGVVVLRSVTTFDPAGGEKEHYKLLLEGVRNFTPRARPAFLNVFVQCYPMSPTLLRELLEELGEEYVPVRPDHIWELYREYRLRSRL